jgi:hypothetical protein
MPPLEIPPLGLETEAYVHDSRGHPAFTTNPLAG